MKILAVHDNYRKRALDIVIAGQTLTFPYDRLRLQPTATDRIASAAPDPQAGGEAFTYRLATGEEDTIHLDAVLEVNGDPEYLQQLLLHTLTPEARAALTERGIGVRAAARRLGTSPTQIYRLWIRRRAASRLGSWWRCWGWRTGRWRWS